ncbi:hypothetical protein [Azospirillum picis]|uniref:Uncharacterized protein n=1 Tax=Azospirillum picis TaxID=488438 RepID=A0ABU0MUJ9_9PROT|nr:hypothetical protein [Azospirillum picis]MBP2303325.1 hypothetical protein [Azospirillum picis]MDQ0537135.1 hypothetical protein [Azospirillum picis]
MSFRTRSQVLFGAVQTAPYTAAAITAADAVRVSNLTTETPFDVNETNYHQDSTNTAAPDAGGGYASWKWGRNLTGSGVVGTAPREDWMLRGAGLECRQVSALAETAASYSTVGGLPTLAFADAATPLTSNPTGVVIEITAGKGAGQRRVVVDYDEDTDTATLSAPFGLDRRGNADASLVPDATSRYAIPAGWLYTPRLDGYERVTAHAYKRNAADSTKSRRKRMTDAVFSFSMTLEPGKPVSVSYQARGVLAGKPEPAALPDDIEYGPEAGTAPPLLGADVALGGRPSGRFSQMTFDLAATLDQFGDASAALGYDEGDITEHKTGGKITLEMLALDEVDHLADFLTGTPRHFHAIWGSAGNGFGFWSEIKKQGPTDEDVRGRQAEGVAFRSHRPQRWFTLHAF